MSRLTFGIQSVSQLMKWRKRLIGSFVILTTCTLSAASTPTLKLGKNEVSATRVLARFKAGASAQQRTDALASRGASVYRQFSRIANVVAINLAPAPQLKSVVTVPSTPTNPGKVLLRRIQALMDTGAFDFVEPDYIVHVTRTPTDTAYGNGTLWGLNNTGNNGGVVGADIQAAAAWDITTGSTNVIVGVVDTGIRYTHQELASQMWYNPGEIAGNGLDDDNDGYVDDVHGINAILGTGDPMDDDDHGTHVSGTIGAMANGGGPHVGVAWNVRLMALKFLDAHGSGNISDAITCIDYAIAKKQQLGPSVRMILSASWGANGFDQSLMNAIMAARDANILFVTAAGNDSNNNDSAPFYPASYPVDNIVAVAAIDRANNLASFSNYGATSVQLGAPGVRIYSCIATSDTAYDTYDGTSMATPHVSGVAALIWAQYPTATYSEVRQRLLVGTVPIPSLNGRTSTGGRLSALNALTVQPDGTLEISTSVQGGLRVATNSTVIVRVSVTDLSPVTNATVTASLSTGGTLAFVNNGTGPDTTANDNVYSADLTVPEGVSTFDLAISATAPGKSPAQSSVTFTVIIPPPPPPNDMFTNADIITSVPILQTGSNLNATPESGEPNPASAGGGSTVWWKWTASTTSVVTASTDGSDFDTVLGVYTGNSVTSLTSLGADDDLAGAFTSTVLFPAQIGQTYYFLVDGYLGAQGNIQFSLNLDPPLTNDNFANRSSISGINQTLTGYNLGATHEAGEPASNGQPANHSVWWEWNSGSVGGPVYISTAGSSFDTRIAIYTGASLGGLNLLAQNDNVDSFDSFFQSEASFIASPGQKYQITVDSTNGVDGAIELTIAQTPDNDNFVDARPLSGDFAIDTGWNIGGTGENGEPGVTTGLLTSKSVWWKWTAPRNGNAVITTDGSPFDTTLTVYTGTAITNLSQVAFNDDRANQVHTSLVTFGAVQGTTYYIRVDGFYYSGSDPYLGTSWAWVDDGAIDLLLTMDGTSKLGTPNIRPDGTLSFQLIGEPERTYVLSSTPDFTNWTPVLTNAPISRLLPFSQTWVPGDTQLFYRALPASLVGGK